MPPRWLWQTRSTPRMGVSIEPRFSVGATVGHIAAAMGGGMVTLYDADGHMLQVPAPEVDHWIGQGYQRTPELPSDAIAAVLASLSTFDQLVSSLRSAETFSRAEGEIAHRLRDAFVELEADYRHMVAVLEAAHPQT